MGENTKILCKDNKKFENICKISISWCYVINICTVLVHNLIRGINYDG